jgi:hypothetical protein
VLPEDVRSTGELIQTACHHEKQVRQAVNVLSRDIGYGMAIVDRNKGALDTPAGAACDMTMGGRTRAAGQYEFLQWG